MYEKKHDDFFDESTAQVSPEEQLLAMIKNYDKPIIAGPEVGAKVTGKILSIGKQYAFVDINAKNEAMIAIAELGAVAGAPAKQPGDAIEAYIVSTTGGEIILSSSLSKKDGGRTGLSELVDAMKRKIPVEGKVTGVNKGGFNVKVLGQRAFCPISQIDLKRVEDPNTFLNASLSFVITQVTEGGRNIVVSRLPLLEEAMGSVIVELEKGIAEKKVYTGAITRIAPFGLFVDLGEIEGLVHISEAAWERTDDLNKEYSVGQKVACVIKSIEKKEPLRSSKISLSIKQVSADPWTTVTQRFKPGETVDGKITRLASFGAFVQLCPGIEGLIHVSEMSWTKRVGHPSDILAQGQAVRVSILSIDGAKREVSCSLKDLDADPWKDIAESMPVGSAKTGTVSQETKFGYFIDLAEGVTGLLPFGNIAREKKESIKVGGVLETIIESIDQERRRISLSCGVAESKQEAAAVKEFLKTQQTVSRQTEAETAFGAALKKAMEKK
ncbi:MAG TPA: S1 RNA-binding domain-containing protein [Chitinivibrionales bacterium]